MELNKNKETVHAQNREEWRKWLEKNHQKALSVWLIIYRKTSTVKSIYYDVAVEEALCFGWIDSTANKRDEESYYLYFAKRKPNSKWSRANRARVEKMMIAGKMTSAGQAMIDLAKKTGMWEALEEAQSSVIPKDLQAGLNKNKKALQYFQAFPPSSKRIILEWILNAKRPETRQKRIEETIRLAADNIRANHYRQ